MQNTMHQKENKFKIKSSMTTVNILDHLLQPNSTYFSVIEILLYSFHNLIKP